MGWCWVEQTLKNECPLRVCSHMKSINRWLLRLLKEKAVAMWTYGILWTSLARNRGLIGVIGSPNSTSRTTQPSRPFFAAQHGIATVRPMSRNLRWAATHSSRCVEDSTCWQQFWISKRPCAAKGFLRAFQIFRHNQFLLHNHLQQWNLEIFHSGEATPQDHPTPPDFPSCGTKTFGFGSRSPNSWRLQCLVKGKWSLGLDSWKILATYGWLWKLKTGRFISSPTLVCKPLTVINHSRYGI